MARFKESFFEGEVPCPQKDRKVFTVRLLKEESAQIQLALQSIVDAANADPIDPDLALTPSTDIRLRFQQLGGEHAQKYFIEERDDVYMVVGDDREVVLVVGEDTVGRMTMVCRFELAKDARALHFVRSNSMDSNQLFILLDRLLFSELRFVAQPNNHNHGEVYQRFAPFFGKTV